MSMHIDWLKKRDIVIAEARADLIGLLAYVDIVDVLGIENDDLIYKTMTDTRVRKSLLKKMTREDLLSKCQVSEKVALAIKILPAEDFVNMMEECSDIACSASSECYPGVDPDILRAIIYEDVATHTMDDNIHKDYCPWEEKYNSVFVALEITKNVSYAAHNAHARTENNPRESASFVPHRQVGSPDGDGDGEPPRPRHSLSFQPLQTQSSHSALSALICIMGVAA